MSGARERADSALACFPVVSASASQQHRKPLSLRWRIQWARVAVSFSTVVVRLRPEGGHKVQMWLCRQVKEGASSAEGSSAAA